MNLIAKLCTANLCSVHRCAVSLTLCVYTVQCTVTFYCARLHLSLCKCYGDGEDVLLARLDAGFELHCNSTSIWYCAWCFKTALEFSVHLVISCAAAPWLVSVPPPVYLAAAFSFLKCFICESSSFLDHPFLSHFWVWWWQIGKKSNVKKTAMWPKAIHRAKEGFNASMRRRNPVWILSTG